MTMLKAWMSTFCRNGGQLELQADRVIVGGACILCRNGFKCIKVVNPNPQKGVDFSCMHVVCINASVTSAHSCVISYMHMCSTPTRSCCQP